MKYTIFSIDDRRKHYTDLIREELVDWREVQTKCVDGRNRRQLMSAIDYYGFDIKYDALVGQLGIWYTVLNALPHAPLVTIEDDGLLGQNFIANFDHRIAELPEDFDYFALFLPRDQDHVWRNNWQALDIGSEYLCRVYQRYGGVSMYYSQTGVDKIRRLLDRDGICDQYDNTLHNYARTGELNGYTSKPTVSELVYITGLEESIVQESEYFK